MLTARQVADLNWHPLRNLTKYGRPENYALAVEGYRGSTSLFYVMACGHRSLPGLTVCERGCRTAPSWPQPTRRVA